MTKPVAKLKLNLGCGRRRREGFVNVDSQPGCQPDQVVDLEQAPWPWPDDAADEVEMIHVLEHLGQAPAVYLALMQELWRVCCDGALIHIVVPHPRSDYFLNDPTHVRPITQDGLELFSQRLNALWESKGASNTPLGQYLGIDFEIESAQLALDPSWQEKLRRGEISEAELRRKGNSEYNVFSELSVVLRVIKPAGRLLALAPASAEPAAVGTDWRRAAEAALVAGDAPQALAVLEAVLAQAPEDHEARSHLAAILHATGQLQAAYDHYSRVAEAGMSNFELHNNLGVAALELGLAKEAVAAFRQALDLAPGNPMVRANLAEALGKAGQVAEAVGLYEGLIQEAPEKAETYVDLAKLFIGQGWFADALKALDLARSFGLEDAEALNQRGIAARELGRDEEALAAIQAGLEQLPGNIPLLVNEANALARLGRDAEAEAIYRQAQAGGGAECPEELGFSFACFLLKRGRTDEGWPYYESRRLSRAVRHHPLEASLPQWRGEAVAPGSSLLITAEQGFGDNLQFMRLLPEVARRFGRVCLETRPALVKLVSRSLAGVCEVVEAGTEVGTAFDRLCPIASLPLALDLGVADWGMAAPYLKVDAMQAALWGFRIPAGTLSKVGLCWGSGKSPRFRHRCDLPLPVAESLLAADGVRWLSLQKTGFEDWRRQQAEAGRLVDLMDLAASFDDTASLIANLDLVVTIDTSIAHLAGALGKPVWLLLAADADWRWLAAREDSPWYPSMRVFRQETPDDWLEVGERVAQALRTFQGSGPWVK